MRRSTIRSIIVWMSVEQEIKNKALELGFDAAGITDASPIGREHVEHFEAWLRTGYAGRMHYMHRNLPKRIDPAQLLEGARSVIVVALSYKPPAPATAVAPPTTLAVGKIAQYTQYEDYHPFIKSLLRKLADFLQYQTGRAERFKLCVDSAPVMEKALAIRAGLGFIGKNHLLIHPQLGPQVLLGELITTADLQPDQPVRGTCGSCDLCLRACPTGALRSDGFLDARQCISYQTQYEPSPEGTSWLFGCDECLLACPYQQRAPDSTNRCFKRYTERENLTLDEVTGLTPEEFETRFHDSPIRRLGLERLKCNARRCLKREL
jgi:epoxyqueuosine reductase